MRFIWKLGPSPKTSASNDFRDWQTQKYMIEDDLTYRLDIIPEETRIAAPAVLYALLGVAACILVFLDADQGHTWRFLGYLACANLAAFGLTLTSAKGVLPAGFLFLMLGITELNISEVLFIAVTITLLQEVQTVRRLAEAPGLIYAVARMAFGITAAQSAYETTIDLGGSALYPLPIMVSAVVLIANRVLAALLLPKQGDTYFETFKRECQPLLPWFIATAYLAYLVERVGVQTGLSPAWIALPMLFTVDLGYRAWCKEIAERKEEVLRLHRNTLETLALAIDARDQTTHMHLRRVQVYALAIGRELGLSTAELESLYVAALLHDIGKLGIPDHILLKPGSLTAPEWEKMKSHAEIGAEMLSHMSFPPLVSSIVITHHEKWDGTGYPKGLSGGDIPVGSRILSAVDCLDALASDRPYRAALPLEEAMNMVRNQSGKAYDPAIIAVLERRYVELDQLAREIVGPPTVDTKPVAAPAPEQSIATLASSVLAESSNAIKEDIFDPIVSARQEDQLLITLANDLGRSTRLDEVVPVIHNCLSQKINYDTMALFVRRQDDMEPIYILGDGENLFSRGAFSLEGGLSGWVARHGKPILNGNVSLEKCYSNNSRVLNNLQSALSVPFEGKNGTEGVITLYHLDRNAFRQDDLRILEAASSQIGPAIEGALQFKEAEETAATDHLTGLPNGRALASYLQRQLQKASHEQSSMGVLVCDLDGFKQVNDCFGHLTGDEVLRAVASGLRHASRDSDYLARIGGDEFVIVLPGVRDDHSDQLQRLREVAVQAGLTVCGERCLSMSFGLSIYPADGLDADTLIQKADQRMYQQKNESKSMSQRMSILLDDADSDLGEPLRDLSRVLSSDRQAALSTDPEGRPQAV